MMVNLQTCSVMKTMCLTVMTSLCILSRKITKWKSKDITGAIAHSFQQRRRLRMAVAQTKIQKPTRLQSYAITNPTNNSKLLDKW